MGTESTTSLPAGRAVKSFYGSSMLALCAVPLWVTKCVLLACNWQFDLLVTSNLSHHYVLPKAVVGQALFSLRAMAMLLERMHG